MKDQKQVPITELLKKGEATFSIEFFPPKDEDTWERFHQTAAKLATLKPDFVSITYGAGGTTHERTEQAARELKDRYGFIVMPHLTCVGATEGEIVELVGSWWEEGYRNVMALRGDPPKGETTFQPTAGGPRYGSELIQLLKKHFPDLCVGGGAYPEKHPEASSAEEDMRNLGKKIEAGVDFLTTQLFFDNDSFYRFRETARARFAEIPLLAGIMPVLSYTQIKRFTKMCGSTLPASLLKELEPISDDKLAVENKGIDWACSQIRDLFENETEGVHLYALNRARAAITLADRLNLRATVPSP